MLDTESSLPLVDSLSQPRLPLVRITGPRHLNEPHASLDRPMPQLVSLDGTLPVLFAWAYSTGASTLSPPGGGVTGVSNDHVIHNMIAGATAGGAGVGSLVIPY
jgi:hypothetical protein